MDKMKALARLHRFTHLFKSLLFKNKFGTFKCNRLIFVAAFSGTVIILPV